MPYRGHSTSSGFYPEESSSGEMYFEEELRRQEEEREFITDFCYLSREELFEKYPSLEDQKRIFFEMLSRESSQIDKYLDFFSPALFTIELAEELLRNRGYVFHFMESNLPLFIKGASDQERLFHLVKEKLGFPFIVDHLREFSFDKRAFLEECLASGKYELVASRIDYFPPELHPIAAQKLEELGETRVLLSYLNKFQGIDDYSLSQRLCGNKIDLERLARHVMQFEKLDPIVVQKFREQKLANGIVGLIQMGEIDPPTKEDYLLILDSAQMKFTNPPSVREFLASHWDVFPDAKEKEIFEMLLKRDPLLILKNLDRFPSYSPEKMIYEFQHKPGLKKGVADAMIGSFAYLFPSEMQSALVEAAWKSGIEQAKTSILGKLKYFKGLSANVASILLHKYPHQVLGALDAFMPGAVDQERLVDRMLYDRSYKDFFPKPKGLTVPYREVLGRIFNQVSLDGMRGLVVLLSESDRKWLGEFCLKKDPITYYKNIDLFKNQEIPPKESDIMEVVLISLRSFKDPKKVLAQFHEYKDFGDYQEIAKARLVDSLKYLELEEWELWLDEVDLNDRVYAKTKVRIEKELLNLLPRLLRLGLPGDAKKIMALCKRFHLAISDEIEKRVEEAEVVKEERTPRAIVEKPVDVLGDMTKFYTHQLIAAHLPTQQEKRDARLHGIDLPVRTWVDLNDMTRGFEAHERRIAHWMKQYVVFAVVSELRHQIEHEYALGRETSVELPCLELTDEEQHYQEKYSHPVDQFLSLATPTEIRRFLFQAEQRFLQRGWSACYGGKAWAMISRISADVWKEDMPLTIQIDRIFDLQHNTGCIFDKRPDQVKEDENGIKEFLDFKFRQTGSREVWGKVLRRLLDLDQ
ncbi:MAG: hypothetical protein UT94_C0042G0001, partial [Candidatus Uhrbacteria bacterium GW2011_GWF2_40_263]